MCNCEWRSVVLFFKNLIYFFVSHSSLDYYTTSDTVLFRICGRASSVQELTVNVRFPYLVTFTPSIIKYFTGTHEDQSKKMIEHMFRVNNIRLHTSADKHEKALRLITSFITGDCITWRELLTPKEMYLTEIVSNKFCSLDVDKCDYLMRDLHYFFERVTVKPSNDLSERETVKPFKDFLARARIVFDTNGTSHIGYHEDDFKSIEQLFFNRAYFHMNVYQQKQVAAAEKMVKDICSKGSAGGVTVAGLELTEVQQNCNAYTNLDDSVLDLIANSEINNKFIKEAKRCLKDLHENRRYSFVSEPVNNNGLKICKQLSDKFGSVFCVVDKFIPAAEVPPNIPFYKDNLERVQLASSLKLSYKSEMIFCTSPDKVVLTKVKSYVDSMSNNNV